MKKAGMLLIFPLFLLLLPLLLLMMLPGLVFGGFSEAYSTADPDNPVLNSSTAMAANAGKITSAINSILWEGMEEAEERIEEDFSLSGCDCMEIINPYENDPVFNANLFISQYSACRSGDYESISLTDMEALLRDHMEELYSYTWTEEWRERPLTEEERNAAMASAGAQAESSPETGTEASSSFDSGKARRLPAPPIADASDREDAGNTDSTGDTTEEDTTEGDAPEETFPETTIPSTVTEKWRIYTLVYNGEAYFADRIFCLTDRQKALAADYAANLSLFLGDGLLQNLPAWNGSTLPALGNLSFTDGSTPVVYFSQMDERYAGKAYGTDTIGGYGCGPTAMAMVVSSLTADMVDPVEMAGWSYENGYWCKGSGSYHALIPAAAAGWKLPVSGCSASEPQRILDALSEGKLVVAIMGKGHFTSSGHFIVLRGVKDGLILVADPASYTRSEQTWELSLILKEAGKNAGAGGPFWIIG